MGDDGIREYFGNEGIKTETEERTDNKGRSVSVLLVEDDHRDDVLRLLEEINRKVAGVGKARKRGRD